MFKLIFIISVIFTINSSLSNVINSAPENSFSAQQLGQTFAQCFGENEFSKCFVNKIFEMIDLALASKENWKLSDYLIVEKNAINHTIRTKNRNHFDEILNNTREQLPHVPFKGTLALKLLQLAQTRSLRIQLPLSTVNKFLNKCSISSTLTELNANTNEVGAENVGAIGQQLEQEEGRRKKYKEKNMAMVGGMAMLAMVAQMFLSKVILIAGAAFVMAKVALLISTLGSLRKGTSGSGVGTEHVVVAGGGGHSHEHTSNWHRRIPYEYNKYERVVAAEQKSTDAENNYLTKLNPFQKQPSKNKFNKINLK